MAKSMKKIMYKLVHKATNYKSKPAKPKAINDVVLSTFKDGSVFIIDAIGQRLNIKENWAVVLKGLILIHNCYEAGSPEFVEAMKDRKHIFALQRFKSSPQGQQNPLHVFITKYARYLEEKTNIVKHFGFQIEKKTDDVENYGQSDLIKSLPKIQSQFNALCNCKITNVQRASYIITKAYLLLLRDSILLYSCLSNVVMKLYDLFPKMSRKDALNYINYYRLFAKETNAIIKIYDGARSISGSLPNVDKIEEDIIADLEKKVNSLNGGDDDDVATEDIPEEELMGTNKSFILNTTNAALMNDSPDKDNESGSDSSGDDDGNIQSDDFFNFISGVPRSISNTPSKNTTFNPFLSDTAPSNGATSNGANLFGGINTPTSSPSNSPFQTHNSNIFFGTPNITGSITYQNNTPQTSNTNNGSFDPFASLFNLQPQTNQTNTSVSSNNNPFGGAFNTSTSVSGGISNDPFGVSSNPGGSGGTFNPFLSGNNGANVQSNVSFSQNKSFGGSGGGNPFL